MPGGKPAYAYLRVSTKEQTESGANGLPRQLEHIHEIAQRRGYRIDWNMIHADDSSGFDFEDRDALTALRKVIKNPTRKADTVILEELDRLSRESTWHQGFLLHELKQHSITVVFWKNFSSRIEQAVMGAIAHDGMEQAKARMKAGNTAKAKSGRITARRAAYGYKLVDSKGNTGETTRRDTHYAIDDKETAVVRHIFEQIGYEGVPSTRLAGELEKLYPAPKNMQHWTQGMVTNIVKNPAYKGEFAANRWHQGSG